MVQKLPGLSHPFVAYVLTESGGRSAELAGEAAQWWLSSGRDAPASWDRHRSLCPAKNMLRTKNKMSGGNRRTEKTHQNMTACSRSIS